MHSKVIDPNKDGQKAYDNKGSCAELIHYLGHEARENGQDSVFFNGEKDNVPKELVIESIDNNRKGLGKNEVKFYSLIISPGEKELRHIGNDHEKLKNFTKQVMENYAKNFNLKEDRELSSKDLVWYATIHNDRTYKGWDQDVKDGLVKQGDKKSGLNTHIHITVSKRDREQKISLDPRGRKDRFLMKQWQSTNGESFRQMFRYREKTISDKLYSTRLDQARMERYHNAVKERVERINLMLPHTHQLNVNKIYDIAAKRNYDRGLFRNLKHLETRVKENRPLRDPYHLLEYNRDKKSALEQASTLSKSFEGVLKDIEMEAEKSESFIETPDLQRKSKKQSLRRQRAGEMEID